jgi:DNA-binding HxlR family transcriptional regulator
MSTRPALPGRQVRGSATGRPIMALLDLLGRRGTLRLLWELRGGEAQTFRVVQAAAGGMSSSVLNVRLRELREARLVALGESGYALTPLGRQLLDELGTLNKWAQAWARQV